MKNSSKHGVGLKVLFIGIVVMALMIGLLIIRLTLEGRESTYRYAVQDITKSAGGPFYLAGPEAIVSGTHTWYNTEKKVTETDDITVSIPLVSLDVQADLKTDVRKIGIYSAPVFRGSVTAKAKLVYDLKNSEGYKYSPADSVICIFSSSSNLTRHPVIKVNGTEYTADTLESEGKGKGKIGIRCPLVNGENEIEVIMDIRGAESFGFSPDAGQNTMNVRCDWPSPSFTFGSYLPDTRDIRDDGFDATWNIPFPNSDAIVGFRYVQSVDLYKLLERAVTYGFLFIIVPFIVMFMFELFAGINLHPMNYLLCGAACVVFFLLLLALSEHIAFLTSYIIGACAASLLVSLYLASVTKRPGMGLAMTGSFVILYLYLFFSLKSEDYAFLMGAIFIFIILALVMFFTRNVDWSNLGRHKKETEELPQN